MSQRMMQQESFLTEEHREVLSHARYVYGNTKQILVSNEELCELAAVCAKFPRYDDPYKARQELHKKAVDEVADVIIVLDHIINIFQLEDEEIQARISGKIERLKRWMDASNSMEQTTVDREVHEGSKPKVPCGTCKHFGNFQNLKPGHICCTCVTSNYSMFELALEGEG